MVISGLIRKHVISHHPAPISLPLNGSFPIILTAKAMIQMNAGCSESVRRKEPRSFATNNLTL